MGGPTSAPGAVWVVVVESHAVLRESLELALSASGYSVVRVPAAPGPLALADAVAEVVDAAPQIALVGVDRGEPGGGMRYVAPLSRNGIKVVAMTSTTSRSHWGEAVRSGAAAVHSRSRPLPEILATVHRLAADLPVMSAAERGALAAHEPGGDRRETVARLEGLTRREAAVLGELVRGHPVRVVAEQWGVREATVRSHVRSILAKLGVTTQLAAVGRANDVGWRPPPR